jgi:hypothetical protein
MTNSEWHDAAQQQERGGELLLAAIRQAQDEQAESLDEYSVIDIGEFYEQARLPVNARAKSMTDLLNRAVEIFRESQR